METIFDRFGILLIAFVILIIRLVFRSAAATSDKADAPDTTGAPAQSVAKADAQVDKAHTRMTMQRHITARKAELQAQRANNKAAQTTPSSKNPKKSRQQAAAVQPAQTVESTGSDRNEWMEGFDIRRAVVWSEILRPKFREDEA